MKKVYHLYCNRHTDCSVCINHYRLIYFNLVDLSVSSIIIYLSVSSIIVDMSVLSIIIDLSVSSIIIDLSVLDNSGQQSSQWYYGQHRQLLLRLYQLPFQFQNQGITIFLIHSYSKKGRQVGDDKACICLPTKCGTDNQQRVSRVSIYHIFVPVASRSLISFFSDSINWTSISPFR